MDKKQIIKELVVLIELANMKEEFGIGTRFDTPSEDERIKSITSFLYDLLKVEEDEENENLLRLLQNSIERNMEGE